MITTNFKKFKNFAVCYGSLRKGDIIKHKNDTQSGIHEVFYGIRGDGFVHCPELDETIRPQVMERYIENISRFEYKPLEYESLSENISDYLMFIRVNGARITSITDMWMKTDEQKVIDISEDETILCFEGIAEITHSKGSKILENLNGVTSSSNQKIAVKSVKAAKLIRVKVTHT